MQISTCTLVSKSNQQLISLLLYSQWLILGCSSLLEEPLWQYPSSRHSQITSSSSVSNGFEIVHSGVRKSSKQQFDQKFRGIHWLQAMKLIELGVAREPLRRWFVRCEKNRHVWHCMNKFTRTIQFIVNNVKEKNRVQRSSHRVVYLIHNPSTFVPGSKIAARKRLEAPRIRTAAPLVVTKTHRIPSAKQLWYIHNWVCPQMVIFTNLLQFPWKIMLGLKFTPFWTNPAYQSLNHNARFDVGIVGCTRGWLFVSFFLIILFEFHECPTWFGRCSAHSRWTFGGMPR